MDYNYPKDAITKILYTDNAPEICPVLLEANSTTPVTLLGAYVNSGAGVAYIKIDSEVYLMNNLQNRYTFKQAPVVFENKAITCEWVKGKEYDLTIVYVDRDFISEIRSGENLELITNSETGAEFYLDKTLNYGEAMILWFVTIFAFFMIFKIAYNFFWKK